MAVICSYIKPDGNRCKAYSLKTGKFCFRHSPEKEAERAQASSAGGRKTARLSKEVQVQAIIGEVITQEEAEGNTVEFHSIEDLFIWAQARLKLISDNRVYKNPSMTEHVISLKYAEFLLKLVQLGSFEDRMQAIEAILDREGNNDRRY